MNPDKREREKNYLSFLKYVFLFVRQTHSFNIALRQYSKFCVDKKVSNRELCLSSIPANKVVHDINCPQNMWIKFFTNMNFINYQCYLILGLKSEKMSAFRNPSKFSRSVATLPRLFSCLAIQMIQTVTLRLISETNSFLICSDVGTKTRRS